MISAGNPHDRFFKETFGRQQVTRDFLRSYLLYHGEESWRWGERLSELYTGPEPLRRYWPELQERLPAIFELLRGLTEQREALVHVGLNAPAVLSC